jgi:hypothetical protein
MKQLSSEIARNICVTLTSQCFLVKANSAQQALEIVYSALEALAMFEIHNRRR